MIFLSMHPKQIHFALRRKIKVDFALLVLLRALLSSPEPQYPWVYISDGAYLYDGLGALTNLTDFIGMQ